MGSRRDGALRLSAPSRGEKSMERRDLLQKAAVTAGAALLAAPKAAFALNNNSTVTVDAAPVSGRRRITATDPDGISSLVVLSRLAPNGSLSTLSVGCGGATPCFV